MRKSVFVAALLPLVAGGCIVRTAVDVATVPVKAGGKVVDWSTTSQSEADRNAGRKLRKQQEREAKEQKRRDKECRKHPDSCDRYTGTSAAPRG